MFPDRKFRTVTELLRFRGNNASDQTAFIFLDNGESELARLTFGDLDRRARGIAARLQGMAQPGDRVLLVYPPGLEFISAWVGCLYAGLIGVPAYPPRKNRPADRLKSIVTDATPIVALTDAATLDGMEHRADGYSETLELNILATDDGFDAPLEQWREPEITPQTLALLQYTSGSTGTPKGVMISHANILSNVEVITEANDCDASTVFVSWLPVFHDMGFFGKVLLPIYLGVLSVLMAPAAFVQKPVRWLNAITKYRGTHCAAPDFAYDLCARKVSDEAKAQLDLSSWRVAFNGAEPVRAETVARFTQAFASCGFEAETMRPVYGMAEATLFISGQPARSRPLVVDFDADDLAQGVATKSTQGKLHALVSCGRVWAEHRLRIVNADSGVRCAPGQIGEIWLSGPSVGVGYWNRAEETEHTFRAKLSDDDSAYMRTGDLGFVDGEDLFVTGRLKDLIIVAGRNHYPQDLEQSAEACHPALTPSASAAFSINVDNVERVVIACEVRREALNTLNAEAVAAEIRRTLAEVHDVDLYAAVLLRPATILRTSSGKIQRRRTRDAFLSGQGLAIAGEWRRSFAAEHVQPAAVASATTATAATPAASPVTTRDSKTLVQWFIEHVSRLAGIAPAGIDPDAPFSAYGLESKDAIALSGELQDWLGVPIAPTVVYDFPSISILARHLSGTTNDSSDSASTSTGTRPDIAIVGMGCRFPGANNPAEFWQLLQEGRDAVGASKKRADDLPTTGLLDQIDQFDAEFFGISAREAETMDPQQRLLLEVAWETLEHAGTAPRDLAGAQTAVIVGISNTDYIRLAQQEAADVGPYVATGNALSVAANRISYTLDLRGPSWAVDTACSSSLVAVHQACRALLRGECDAALAGGANLILAPQLSASFTQSGMLSPDGRCKAFDASANGYVRGEGVGMVLLKRLDDALANGDTVFAVIRGSAVNQDGRSNGLTAPNGPAQQAVIRSAQHDAGVRPQDIGYVEAHGTGTPLGDPIELNSLTAVLSESRRPDDVCWIGSVKTNIGHLESAAGIASLIKTALTLHHREIPPNLHYRTLNPHIALDNTPFRIPQQVTPWHSEHAPRIAGVSSFGFGGTNAHVILSEAPRPIEEIEADSTTTSVASLVTLSARTPEALQALAASYAAYLDANPQVCVQDFAFTTNTGRTHFARRGAIVASSRDTLRAQLDALAASAATETPPSVTFHFATDDGASAEAVRQLLSVSPTFRALLHRHCETPELAAPDALYVAFQQALAQLWISFGITPDAISSAGAGQRAAASFTDVPQTPESSTAATQNIVIEIGAQAGTWDAILHKLGELYVRGATIDWNAFEHDHPRRRLALPTYPFERRRFWITPREPQHPLLGRLMEQQAHLPTTWTWESRFDAPATTFLSGHRIKGAPVLPYSAYVEMALAATSQIGSASHTTLKDLALHAPLSLREHESHTVQTVLSRESFGPFSFAVYHRIEDTGAAAQWQMCASAEIHESDRSHV
ncbi:MULTISPECIES: beta-ketoacyl synthase N-terminal-like domain-containing protein [Paraburkholderia]|uniref:hybrid fatty acyl-AMP ligase/type I polyketide synthase n=1 Tax=Paraburkholderia TaxID=1822464 RepID=UPI00225C3D1C|nr:MULTISPECIES: beta-ketoacyl synthase N-terminal-like domain-containing protein [Paraburkholderia]MCX4165234.1 beta-ketoacyl synthase N-terminal-like domain-containing protein [Paraburkholderia megapolitana]MDN7160726.1 AMP-binding protein [Paraburkholderia sp. CHISQ3]MDQ6497773.1 AMP-binding protein [Paraburkholderia megapolitana]